MSMTLFYLLALALFAPVWATPVGAASTGPSRTNLAITVRVLGGDSRPTAGSLTFWRAVEGASDAMDSLDYFRGMSEQAQRWQDRINGKTWQPFYNYGAGKEATLDKLMPGDYRVTASLGNDPAPFGLSGIIHLDGLVTHTNIALQLQPGSSLTVSAMDAQTQQPLPLFQVMLVRDDGFPVTRWSSSPWALWSREEERSFKFSQLAPGNYRLEVRRPAFYASQAEYVPANGPIAVNIKVGQDQRITALLKAVPLPEEVLRQRWPFVVMGRVTDDRGRPLPGVQITAHCGMGTLLPTGEILSGPDGRYLLRFNGVMRMRDGDQWRVGLQAATISPAKAGYVEANLHRQGDLLMAGRLPGPNENTGWKVKRDKVVLPEQPFPLDFVMVRAATLQGRLVDVQGRPLAGQRLYISGPELPPSCSVLAEVKTDSDGRFQCDNLPVRRAWWFTMPDRGDVRSQAVNFDQPSVHRVDLRFTSRDNKPVLEVTERSAENSASSAGLSPSAASQLRELLLARKWDEARQLAGCAARWPDTVNGSEGLIRTNTPILLDWDLCDPRGVVTAPPAQHPHIDGYPWLEFAPTPNGLSATLHLKAASYPKTLWNLILQRMDRSGAFVIVHSQQEKRIENSGTIEKYPSLEDLEANWRLEDAATQSAPGMLFQISIATVWTEQGNPVRWDEAMPITLDLGMPERSKVLRATSLKLEPAGDSVQAAVTTEILPWPKFRWRLTLTLADADGKSVGQGERTGENEGVKGEASVAARKQFRFPIQGSLQAIQTAQRWTLRVEKLSSANMLPPHPTRAMKQ